MNQRSALLIAAALTAFLLVLVGGLANRLSTSADLGATATVIAPTENLPPTAVVALDPTVEALIKEREAAYQQAIVEANNRLSQANAQIAQANTQINTLEQSQQQIADQFNQSQAALAAPIAVAHAAAVAPTAAPAPAPKPAPAPAPAPAPTQAPPAAPTYAISPEQAVSIALGVAAPGATLTKAPELVSYEGKPAYEVILNKGAVYVDAQTGAVLANTAAAPKLITQEQAVKAAQAYLGGGTVKSISLQDDNGAQTYQIQFSDDSKVYVDAITGQVVYAEIRTNTSQNASSGNGSGGGGGEHEGGEHEGGEHQGGGDD
jgi:uncharacterized membrane protein YkoI